MNAMRLRLTAIPLAVILLFTAGCDSADDDGVDAAFFVGTWLLEGVRDGSGDRTTDVAEVIDVFRVTFVGGGTFSLVIEYTDATGQPPAELAGTYAMSQAGQLVLTAGGIALAFDVTVLTNNRIELRAPAAIVEPAIAGTEIDIGLVGTVVLTLAR